MSSFGRTCSTIQQVTWGARCLNRTTKHYRAGLIPAKIRQCWNWGSRGSRDPGSEDAKSRGASSPTYRAPDWYAPRVTSRPRVLLERRGPRTELTAFQVDFDGSRVRSSLDGDTPAEASGDSGASRAGLANFGWQPHCQGLYGLPVAASLPIRAAGLTETRCQRLLCLLHHRQQVALDGVDARR